MRPLTGGFDDPDLVLAHALFDTATARLNHQLSGQRTLTSMLTKRKDTTVLDVPIGVEGRLPVHEEEGTERPGAGASASSAPSQFAPIARAPARSKRIGKGPSPGPNGKKKRA